MRSRELADIAGFQTASSVRSSAGLDRSKMPQQILVPACLLDMRSVPNQSDSDTGTHRLPDHRWPSRNRISARREYRNSRSLRQIRTSRTCPGSRRYTIRNGGWISSLRNCGPNSGTTLPKTGWRSQRFQPLEDLLDQPIPDIGNVLFGVPSLELFKIRHCGFHRIGQWLAAWTISVPVASSPR